MNEGGFFYFQQGTVLQNAIVYISYYVERAEMVIRLYNHLDYGWEIYSKLYIVFFDLDENSIHHAFMQCNKPKC